MLVSIYAVTPMLTALYVGKWLDRFGAKRMLLVGSSLMVFAVSIPVLHVGLSSLFVAQMFLGFSQIFIVVSIQKTVGNLAGSRDKLIATLSFVGSAGGLTGPLLTGFSYDILGVEAAFMVVIGLVSVAWFLIILLRKNCCPITGLSETPKKESTWCLFKNKNLRNALLISGMVLYSKELFSAYFPIFASEQGISPSMIGLILSMMAGASMMVRIVQHHLVNKFGRNHILLLTMIMSGVSYSLIPFFYEPTPLILLSLVLGAGLGLGQPLSLVFALNSSPQGRQGEVLGLRITINRGAQFFAPLLFGAVGTVAGISPIFWVSGGFLLIGTYFTRPAKQLSEKEAIEKDTV